jgi:hypothetical protein
MNQQCGQTWLRTFSEVNNLYNSGRQLPYLQLVTWNDYEEATEIESGIDSCFSLNASISGSTLQWSITGNEDTVDHYNVYLSSDGQNLMTLTTTEPGLRSVNLCSFPIPAGKYQMFVQSAGKPSLANRMPGPVSYSPACGGAAPTPPAPSPSPTQTSSLTASPTTLTISGGESGQVTVSAAATAGTNAGSLALSCDYLPANLMCSFSPSTLKLGNGTATSTLKITNSVTTANSSPMRTNGFAYASWIFSFGIAGFVFLGNFRSARRALPAIVACLIIGSVMLTASCGGGKPSSPPAGGPNTYTISVLGNSGSTQLSTELVVSVQ